MDRDIETSLSLVLAAADDPAAAAHLRWVVTGEVVARQLAIDMAWPADSDDVR